MKGRIITILVIAISLMISVSYTYAIDIDGWWKVKMNVLQGDFVTGKWTKFTGLGKHGAYMYISGVNENSYNLPLYPGSGAWFYLWDGEAGEYIEEIYPFIYVKNGIIVLFMPTGGPDENGNFWGCTIVLRPYQFLGQVYLMKGFYTLFDMENQGSIEQFIRMGALEMNKVNVNNVPKEVKNLQATD